MYVCLSEKTEVHLVDQFKEKLAKLDQKYRQIFET